MAKMLGRLKVPRRCRYGCCTSFPRRKTRRSQTKAIRQFESRLWQNEFLQEQYEEMQERMLREAEEIFQAKMHALRERFGLI